VATLLDREVNHFMRIEEFISGFVDSFWLADEKYFIYGSSESKLLRYVVRKIFYVGTYNLGLLVDQWKEWGNNLFHTLAETITIGDREYAQNNIFRTLDRLPIAIAVRAGDRSMIVQQHVSHLISSRQMPYMGLKTELKAREKFKSVLQSDFQPSQKTIVQMGMAARRIGSICRKIRPGSIPHSVCHVSVTSSGEIDHSVAQGAQALAVKEALVRILTRVPETDEEENTPFGRVTHHCGIPLWRSLFRDEILDTEKSFLDTFTFIKEQGWKFYGLDRALGEQLMYVAWKEYDPTPVLRATVVPEMGNKARHVTLSAYWLNVLQAPLAHVLIDAMKWHPSVFSSFHRQDQAFEAVKGLCRLEIDKYPSIKYALSSDLKDATNAQNWSITKVMLQSFINGYGLSFRSEYVNLVLDLIGPRLVLFDDDTSVLSKTGIMMGEAIAKPSLTLLNLSIEELAFLTHIQKEWYLELNEAAPYRAWRFIHIGGDDHLARGPLPYLKTITDIHIRCGSHISPGQHGYSRYCVKYTERLINLENLKYKRPFCVEDHNRSTIVDSVKVRLLERGQSTLLKKDNKNVAIGKSTQLGGCLEWLPKDDRFYTLNKIESIRALFVERMGSLLPRKAVNPKAFAAIHLPTTVGGYGLGLKSELKYYLERSPRPHHFLLSKAALGLDVRRDLRKFRQLNSNVSARGISCIQDYQEDLIDRLNEYPNYINAIHWTELRQQFPDPLGNARRTIALAANEGILSVEEFVRRATRGNLFQELLLGKESLKVFNTRKFTDTYYRLWQYCESEGMADWPETCDLTSEEIATAIDQMVPQWYFDINQDTTVDVGTIDQETGEESYDFVEGSYIELYQKGLPSLTISPRRLGLRLS